MRKRTPESGVLRACTDLLTAERIWWCRMNTGAVKDGKRFFRFGKKGMADILASAQPHNLEVAHKCEDWCCPDPQFLWIECKAEKGEQTEDQIAFEKEVSMAGHHYLVVRDVNTLIAWLKDHGCI